MKRMLIVSLVAIAVPFAPAAAGERAGDAALGALSGAVVLGPVGAVAGAVVGYTAGPAIARSWGLRRGHRPHAKTVRRSTQAARPARERAAARRNGPAAQSYE
jgi:outer membrane lipoprotein SlyB